MQNEAQSQRGGTNEKVPTSSLAGKVIALLFSGPSFCPPCRNLDQVLKNLYPQVKNKAFEIVFVSADRDQNAFNQVFAGMPWLAIPFDDSHRMQALQSYGINAVPKMTILSAKGGLIAENVASFPLSATHVDSWIQQRM